MAKPPSRRSFEIRLKVNENEKERSEFYEVFHCVGYLDKWTNGKVRPADVQGLYFILAWNKCSFFLCKHIVARERCLKILVKYCLKETEVCH